MPDIVLATLNAKYIHAAFGLRYLHANLGPLRPHAEILEFEIRQPPLEVAEAILERQPRILGLGVYIWNARPSLELVALLKTLRPDLCIVLGGPEVSHETDRQEIVALADHTITGEGDHAFRELCLDLLGTHGSARERPAPPRIIAAPLPDPATLQLPYALYSDADIHHRVLYVEASRGCPFSCEFCLSSLDIPVRQFPLEPLLAELARLIERGALQFKFVDRTFNLNLRTSRAILRFFREHWRDGMFLHFEMVPDRLPEELRSELAAFPPGAMQLEIGIQSFNPEVCARIQRRQDLNRTQDNLRHLRTRTGVHLHADLIAGLPGETLESFRSGFDRLVSLGPQEIQVGILKRLRGTPISRHDQAWGMRFSPHPPYEILQSNTLPFPVVQRLRRFARYWDLVANSGRFTQTLPFLLGVRSSAFDSFLAFSDWLHRQLRQTHAIALDRLAEMIFRWLTAEQHMPPAEAAEPLARDLLGTGRRDAPEWLRAHLSPATGLQPLPAAVQSGRAGAARQRRHLGTPSAPTVPRP